MITRYAFFEGEIHPGREAEFRAFVREKLVPLWTQFPAATEVRIMDELERDAGAPSYAMILAIRYPSRSAVAAALESPARFQSREVTQQLLQMFTGRVHHHVCQTAEYEPRAWGAGNGSPGGGS